MSQTFPDLLLKVVTEVPHNTILDVGCKFMGHLQRFPEARVRVGLEANELYLKYALEQDSGKSVIGLVPVHADARIMGSLFLPKTFDVVMMLDFIEHLLKEDSVKVVDAAEKIARERVVIYTPEGFLPTPPLEDEFDFKATEWQTHRCGWTRQELEARGYKVEPVAGNWVSNFAWRDTVRG